MEAVHPSRTMQKYNQNLFVWIANFVTNFGRFIRPYKDTQLYNLKACTWFADQFRV